MDRATTTAPAKPVTCPPSAVDDQIIPWPEVREGDLVLWDGEFRLVTRLIDYEGAPLMWFDGSKTGPGVLPCGTYAAVRRYAEGSQNATLTKDERALILALIDYAGGAIGRLDCEALRANLEAMG